MIHLLPLVPRQNDDLTGNFLVPQSPWVHTLRVLRENPVLITFRILRNQREQARGSISWLQPYIPSCQGTKPFMVCGGSNDLLSPIRWSTNLIIQRLRPLWRKGFVSIVERTLPTFRASSHSSWLGGICIPTPTHRTRLLCSL